MPITETLFITSLALLIFPLAIWGFKHLPSERWQMLATMPSKRQGAGWSGTNLTFYGLFSAMAYTFAAALFTLLMGTVGTAPLTVMAAAVPILAICIPASRWLAIAVEKKRHTFTVGGASFVGILIAPWVLLAVNTWGFHFGITPMPCLPALAALAIAYAFGEGLGRLACLSFGCCYGKPISALSPKLMPWVRPFALIFSGDTKKIVYASDLSGEPVVPVQAMTLIICCATGLIATALFLRGHMIAASLLPLAVTQIWRVISEWLRADHRGNPSRFSAYQLMALAALPYAAITACSLAPSPSVRPTLSQGILTLWHPGVLLSLQLLWGIVFLYTGRSEVTGATLQFHIHREKI